MTHPKGGGEEVKNAILINENICNILETVHSHTRIKEGRSAFEVLTGKSTGKRPVGKKP